MYLLRADAPVLEITSTFTNREARAAKVEPHWFMYLTLGHRDDVRFFKRDTHGRTQSLMNTFPFGGKRLSGAVGESALRHRPPRRMGSLQR